MTIHSRYVYVVGRTRDRHGGPKVTAGNGSWRFNPPPGWPVPPAGWTPPPNWQPDPTWPPPPAGWAFWVPAGTAAPGQAAPWTTPWQAPPQRSSPGGSGATIVKVVAGALSLIATVAAAWFAFADRPEPYTRDQWRQAAEATCERDFADVRFSLNGAMLKLGQAMAMMPAPGQITPQMSEATVAVGDLARGFRRLSADLAAIKVPEDLSRSDLDRFLAATGAIADGVGQVGDAMVSYQLGQATYQQLQGVTNTLTTLSTTTIPAWQASAQRLGLNRCLPLVTAAT